MPIIKGISEDMEKMVFLLQAKPILNGIGAVKLNFIFPDNLQGMPFLLLIDDIPIDPAENECLLKEGEHHLVLVSENYRNYNRRFMIEQAKILDLKVELQDPTPLLLFEYPENTKIFVNNIPVTNQDLPFPIESGLHEIQFQLSDYTIIRKITVQRGKTYRVALSVDVDVTEND